MRIARLIVPAPACRAACWRMPSRTAVECAGACRRRLLRGATWRPHLGRPDEPGLRPGHGHRGHRPVRL